MQPKFNVWLEQEGNVVLSPWRVQLLEAIAATGSISAADKTLLNPYGVTWCIAAPHLGADQCPSPADGKAAVDRTWMSACYNETTTNWGRNEFSLASER